MKTYTNETTVNREVKDTVFTNIFSKPLYAAQLVEALHPEFAPVECKDVELITIGNVLANGMYNDLAIKCFDRLMVFVEEQSTYNPNIAARLMMYAVLTIKDKVVTNYGINLYSSKKVIFPAIEFFCICAYERKEKYPDYEVFGNEQDSLHCRVKMIYADADEKDIIGQYTNFAKGVTGIMKSDKSKQQIMQEMKEYIAKCIEEGILSDYLSTHQGEVMDIMDVLFNQEFVTERMIIEAKSEALAEGIAEGIAEGKAEGIAKGRAEGILEGKAEGILEGQTSERLKQYIHSAEILMKKQNLSFEETADLLEIPENLLEEVREGINSQK